MNETEGGFLGTTQECLHDWASRLPEPGDKAINQRRAALVSFVGAAPQTVQRWTQHDELPKGENLLRLRVFLDSIGYEVKELEILPVPNRQVAEIVGSRVYSLEKICELIGYSRTQGVLRIALTNEGISEARISQIAKIHSELKGAMEDARLKIRSMEIEAGGNLNPGRSQIEEPPPVTRRESDVTTCAALLLQSVLPLVEHLASDAAKPEDRKRLREMVPGNGVFKCANALNKLCGEEARKSIIARGRK